MSETRKQTIIAEFLVRSALKYCHRETLRALFSAGSTRTYGNSAARVRKGNGPSRNRETRGFQKALKLLEERALITRGAEFVLVEDRAGLAEFVKTSRPLPVDWIDQIEQVAASIEADLEAEDRPAVAEQRRRELLAIQRLMIDVRGERWSGRGSVRFVPRGKVL